ncbi:trypsin-like peptidase domain-containing protein [Azohydromonas sediminis]|uniref:trypsin-like peptidase domain-containing protein n=1 Tax=Azohydromonas sediminis TaxID=2259674 RepID=UPI000E64AA51|nr:trypsin-like peptidase domain-containing protein [Azohydromonas sediminis]
MRRTWLIFSQAVTVAVAVLFVVATLKPEWLARNPARVLPEIVTLHTAPPPATDASTTAVAHGYRLAAQRAAPAVVSIAASRAPAGNPHIDDPWFRFFFGDRQRQVQPQVGLGSGVIVSPEGYVLTNHHVIDGADDIEVQLADGRTARARLVGTDPESDLAVLKVDLPDLPTVVFGDPGSLQVGDVVLAIGNPFNVGQTVTSGIVSALGRNRLGINTFENFIQTDAAINPGNSGGALVDVDGQLVGINTAIYSRSGGSLGIGFAIPGDVARDVLVALIRDGRVTRGWIGVEPRDLTPEFAEHFGLPVRKGVLITGVLQNGPAGAAGMQPGDVVVRVGDREVADTRQLLDAVAALRPGTEVTIGVQRRGERLDLNVRVAQRPAQPPRQP